MLRTTRVFWVAAAVCLLLLAFSAPILAQDGISVGKIEFYNAQSGGVPVAEPGALWAKVYIESDAARNDVAVVAGAYAADGRLEDVRLARPELNAGENIIDTPSVTLSAADSVMKVFLWHDASLKPMEIAAVLDEVGAGNKITSAQLIFDGKSYPAKINQQNDTIVFDVIYSDAATEITNALAGTAPPAVIPDTSGAALTFAAEGAVTDETANPVLSGGAFDLKDRTLTVTAENGKTRTYSVSVSYGILNRKYNFDGASLYAAGETAEYNRIGAPKYLSNSGSSGGGVWRVAGVGHNSSVTYDEEEDFGDFSIVSNALRVNKTRAGGVMILQDQVDTIVRTNRFCASFDLTINGYETPGIDLGFIYTSDTDQLILSVKDCAPGQWRLGYLPGGGQPASVSYFKNCPPLEVGATYNISYVFVRDAAAARGYRMECYVDGVFIGDYATRNAVPEGALSRAFWASSKACPEFFLQLNTAAIADLTLDNYDVSGVPTVDGYTSMAPTVDTKTTVHLLGDSICRYYPAGSAPQQGWGQGLMSYLTNVNVLNYSVGGYNTNIYLNGTNRGSGSLVTDPVWPSVENRIRAGDYVLIALGWNEENATDGTKNQAAFNANLDLLTAKITAKGATPVFVTQTPNMSAVTDAAGEPDYAVAYGGRKFSEFVRAYGANNGYVTLDLHEAMRQKLTRMGSGGNAVNSYFTASATISPNNAPNKDLLHLTTDGAALSARLIANLIDDSQSGLKDFLKPAAANAAFTSAAAVIGGDTYPALVNPMAKTITFDVPFDLKAAYTPADADIVALLDSAKAAQLTLTANGDITDSQNAAITGAHSVDLTASPVYSVTRGGVTESYTVILETSNWARFYAAQNAVIDNNNAAVIRQGAPNYQGTKYGAGGWFLTFTDPAARKNTCTISLPTVDGKKVMRFDKTVTNTNMVLASQASDYPDSKNPRKVTTSMDIKLNSVGEETTGTFLYITSASKDHVLLSRAGAPEGKYYLAYRPNWDDNAAITVTQKPLDMGDWHNIKYVTALDDSVIGGYRTELYLDGEFIAEINATNRFKAEASTLIASDNMLNIYGWSTTAILSSNHINLYAFTGNAMQFDFDNVAISYVPVAAQ